MAVTNPYYEFTPEFIPGTKARSDAVNIQYQAIQNAFDLLPGDGDAITTGTATFAPESGTGNAYVVTMPDTRTTEQDGDEVIFFATHTNTAASTLEVDGLGAKALVQANGDPVVSGDIENGLLYVVRYDATNTRYQLTGPTVSYLADAEAAAAAALVSETNAAASESLAQEWADKAINSAITGNPGLYSARHWADGAAQAWAINAEDSAIGATFGGDGASTFSAYHWAQKSLNAATLQRIVTDLSTSTPPTTEAVTGQLQYYDAAENDELARVGFAGSNQFYITNRMHGGTVRIQGEDSGGFVKDLFIGDPDNTSKLYYAGIERFSTNSSGEAYIKSTTSTDTEARNLGLRWQDGTLRGLMGFLAGNTLYIRNQIHGARVDIEGENSVGTTQQMARFDPDTWAQLYYAGALRFATRSDGIQVNAVGNAASPPSTESMTGGYTILDEDSTSTLGSVGYVASNIMTLRNLMHGGAVQITGENASGTTTNLFVFDPDAGGDLYYTNLKRFGCISTGVDVRSDGNTDAENRYIAFKHQDGTVRGIVGHVSSTTLIIRSTIHGAQVALQGEDAGGVNRNILVGDPDTDVGMYYAGTEVARTVTAASGGFQVNNTSTGGGFERVLTTSDSLSPSITGDINTATPPTTEAVTATLDYLDNDQTDSLAKVGFQGSNTFRVENRMHGGAMQLRGENDSGTAQNLFEGDPDAAVKLYYAGVERVLTGSVGVASIKSDANTDAVNRYIALTHQDNTHRARIGHLGGSSLYIRNMIHGALLIIDSEDLVGTARALLVGDPDGSTSIYYAGSSKVQTATTGAKVVGSVNTATPPTTEAVDTRIELVDGDGTDNLALIGFNTNNVLSLRNRMHGGAITLTGEDAAGTERTILLGDPDTDVKLYQAGTEVARTVVAASGGFQVNNTSTGAGFERVLTTSDSLSPSITGDINTATPPTTEAITATLDYLDNDQTDNLAKVGFQGSNNFRISNTMHGGEVWIEAENTAGANQLCFVGNPDGASAIYHAGTTNSITQVGALQIRSATSTDTETRRVTFAHQDGTQRGFVGYAGGDLLSLYNQIHGGSVSLVAEDALGTVRTLFSGDPDGGSTMYVVGVPRWQANSVGICSFYSDGNTDAENRYIRFNHADGTERANIGHLGGTNFFIRNKVHGATLYLEGEDTGGVVRSLLTGDPDNITSLYYNGVNRFSTDATGSVVIRSDGNTDAEIRRILFTHNNGTTRARMGHTSADSVFQIKNQIDSGTVQITGEDAVSSERVIFFGDPDGYSQMYHIGVPKMRTSADGIFVHTDAVVTPSPPTTNTGTGRIRIVDSDASDTLGELSFFGTPTLFLTNRIHGAPVAIQSEDTGGTAKTLFYGDPDTGVSLYYAGTTRTSMEAGGIFTIRSDTSTDAENRLLIFEHQDGTNRAYVGHSGGATLRIANLVHGGAVSITAEDNAGVERTILSGDPDSTTILTADTDLTLKVATTENALFGEANGRVSLYYNNDEKIRTASSGIEIRADISVLTPPDSADAPLARIQYFDQDGTDLLGQVGFAGGSTLLINNQMHGAQIELRADDAGGTGQSILLGDPDGQTNIYHAGTLRFSTDGTGGAVNVYGDITTLTPPTTEAVTAKIRLADADDTDLLGEIGFTGSQDIYVRNRMHGGRIMLDAEDASGTLKTVFYGDPDDRGILYYAGNTVLRTDGQGIVIQDTSGDDPAILFYDAAFTTRQAFIQSINTNELSIRNEVHGGQILISAEDSLGTVRTILDADPDSTTTLRADTNVELQVAAGELAVRGVANGATELYYDAAKRFASDSTGGAAIYSSGNTDAENRYLSLNHQNGTLRALFGHDTGVSGSTLSIDNRIAAGNVLIRGRNTGDTTNQTMIQADPDGRVDLYYNNIVKLGSSNTGADIRSTGNTDTEERRLTFIHANGTSRGFIGHNNTDELRIRQMIHGGTFAIEAEDAGGTVKEILRSDPDGNTTLRGDVDLLLRVANGELAMNAIGNGATSLYYDNVKRAGTSSTGGWDLFSTGNTDTENRYVGFNYANGTERAQVGHLGGGLFYVRNKVHGGRVLIDGEDDGGVSRSIFLGDPDNSAWIYYNGTERIRTDANGVASLKSDGNTDTEANYLALAYQNNTHRARIGYLSSKDLYIKNQVHTGSLILTGEDTLGTERTFFIGDPDATTVIRGDTDLNLQVSAGGANSLACVGGGAVSVYFNGQVNLRTSNEAGSTIGMGAEIRHNDDAFYPLGMNVVPEADAIDTGNETLALDLCGKMIHYNSATARSLFFNNDSTIPVGAMWSLIVGPSAGTLTGDGGAGVLIRYWNGLSWTTTAAAGNVTIGEGQYTIWKETDTLYHLAGPNIS